MVKIGFYGSCQLNKPVNVFFREEILKGNNLEIIFNIPFYKYDINDPGYLGLLDYSIFDNIDMLIIENNKLKCQASSEKIINYCENKKIKIIKTCLLKFPIYPLNWSGRGENINDYKNFSSLDEIDYKSKFEKCINSLEKEINKTDLSGGIVSFITENYNKKLLFTHSLHPTNILLYELYKSILSNLGINIDLYNYNLKKEIIILWKNPFTSKMMRDLNISFHTQVSDIFYLERYNKNKYLLE